MRSAYDVLVDKADLVLKQHVSPATPLAQRPDGPNVMIEHSDGVRYDFAFSDADDAAREAALAAPSIDKFDFKLAAHCGAAHPDLAELSGDDNPKLLALAAALLGIYDQNGDKNRSMIQIIQQAHFKAPGSKCSFPWHQDSTFRRVYQGDFVDTNGRGSYVNIAIAVDAEFARGGIDPAITPDGEHNGPLGVVPDTWRDGHIGGADGLDPSSIGSASAVYPLLQPGDALCVGPFIVHGSVGSNSAVEWRRSFITGFALPDAIVMKPEAADGNSDAGRKAGMSWFKKRVAPAEGTQVGGRVQVGGASLQ